MTTSYREKERKKGEICSNKAMKTHNRNTSVYVVRIQIVINYDNKEECLVVKEQGEEIRVVPAAACTSATAAPYSANLTGPAMFLISLPAA